MARYLQLPLNQILHGDCRQLLSELPERSIDLVFADPPYNLQIERDLWRPNLTRVNRVDEGWDKFASFTEYDNFTREWLQACRRVLKDNGTLWVIGTYHNIYRIGAILQDLDFWILNDVVWIKSNPMPNFRGVRFTNAQETLIWAQKVKGLPYTFNYQDMKAFNGDIQMRSDWVIPLCTGKERIKVDEHKAHPTQKPEALLYRVIISCTEPGDIVLDPFFGTGTSGAVASKLHRNWIGMEIDQKYVKIARERIASLDLAAYSDQVYHSRPRKKTRVAVGTLIERGWLKPGEQLYFLGKDEVAATLQANGHIHYNGLCGSIHQVARSLKRMPCNGWELWYYHDSQKDTLERLDKLREKLLEERCG